MIEFKRAGDVMVFECPEFRVEISATDAERIVVNPDRHIADSNEMMQLLTDAFKIMDMMIEHKLRQMHVLKMDINHKGLSSEGERLKKQLFESNHIKCGAGK